MFAAVFVQVHLEDRPSLEGSVVGCLVRVLPSEGVWGVLGEDCLDKLDKPELPVDSLEKQQHRLLLGLEQACSSQVQLSNRFIVK